MKRTTIFAEESLLEEIRSLSSEEGQSVSQVIREALTEHVERKRKLRKPLSFLGVGRSGRRTVAERHEQLLWRHRAK